MLRKLTDDFGQGAVVRLDGAGNVFLTNKIGTEKHKRIWWTWDIALRTALSRRTTFTRGCGWSGGRREKGRSGGRRIRV